MKKVFFLFTIFCFIGINFSANAARKLVDTAVVNITSDTSEVAKKMAMVEARRQIIKSSISPFIIDKTLFNDLLINSKDSDLTDLISSVSIDNEQQSATTYSASIKMVLDNDSVKNWLQTNAITNWLDSADSESKDKKVVIITLTNGLQDWIDINISLSESNIDFTVSKILNKQVTLAIQVYDDSKFISAMKKIGCKYSGKASISRFWK